MKTFLLITVVALSSSLGACASMDGAMKSPATAKASQPVFVANRANAVSTVKKAKAATRTDCRAEALMPDGQKLGTVLAEADLRAKLKPGQYLAAPTPKQISDAYVADCMASKAGTIEALEADVASLFAPTVGPK